jgi:hypothetical protein
LKKKTKEYLNKRLKSCERNMQELSDSIKRSNLRIMGIKEGEEIEAKGIHKIFNKIMAENFPNLKKERYFLILTLNVNGLNSPTKRHPLANLIKKEYLTICCLQEAHLIDRNKNWLRVKGWKKIYN